MALTARPFTQSHWETYKDWHRDCEMSRRASYPDETWFNYVTSDNAHHGIVAFENDKRRLVSLAQFEIEDTAMVLFVAVDPSKRRLGLGFDTLNAIISSAPLTISAVDGYIESNNVASIAMAKSAGFAPVSDEIDAEGFQKWRFTL